jgi:hypothetical protein
MWWTFIEICRKIITPLSITREFYNQTFVRTLQITTSDSINFKAAHQPQIRSSFNDNHQMTKWLLTATDIHVTSRVTISLITRKNV